MGVDQNAQHAEGLVVLDETHAAHVGGEVVDLGAAVDGLIAMSLVAKVQDQIFGFGKQLIPLAEGFSIDGPDAVPFFREVGDEMPSMKPPAPVARIFFFIIFSFF